MRFRCGTDQEPHQGGTDQRRTISMGSGTKPRLTIGIRIFPLTLSFGTEMADWFVWQELGATGRDSKVPQCVRALNHITRATYGQQKQAQ